MAGTDIFLSYARTDQATARIFAESFAQEGFNVWWDASLHSGQTFDEVIEQKLRDAKAVVVLWSPRSVASRWVRAEATLADRRHNLAPAIIEPCDRPIIFELTHAADLTEWTGDTSDPRWRNFMQDLRRLVDADPKENVAAPPPAAKPGMSAFGGRPAPVPEPQPLRSGASEATSTGRNVEPPPQPAAPVESERQRAREDEIAAEVHCLQIEGGGASQQPIIVTAASMKVGRAPPAEIVIPDKSVSREHCLLGLSNDELFVTDLNSTNGTYIDGERIKRTTVLPVGSVLQIGQVSLRHAVRTAGDGSDGQDFDRGRLAAMR